MRRWTFSSFLLLAAACASDPSVPKQRDEIVLRLTVARATIRAGEPDTITVRATNNFGDVVQIRFPNSCLIFAYIRDPRGRIVTPGRGWSCLPVVTNLRLAKDESREFKFVWTGLSEFAGVLQPVALPAGEYFATATLQSGEFAVHAPPVRVMLLQP